MLRHKLELNRRLKSYSGFENFSREVKRILAHPKNSKAIVLPSTIKDVLLHYVCHDQTPSCSFDEPICFNSSTLSLDDFLQREAEASANGLNLKQASILRSYGLLNNIDQQIQSWIKISRKHKLLSYSLSSSSLLNLPYFLFFSGHDLTLMYILVSLRLYDGYLPYYASRFTFEVLSKENQYYIRLLWNGEDVTKHICPSTSQEYCNGRFLMSYIRTEMKRYFQTESFVDACQT